MWRFGAVLALAAAGATEAGASTRVDLQGVVDSVVAEHRLVPGTALYVDAPRAGLPWSGAAGQTAEIGGRALRADDHFRIASTMKIFTAAAVLRLVEDRRLGLDDPVAPYVDADQVNAMHVLDGVNHGPRITIRQLLSHTSGLNSHDTCRQGEAAVVTGPNRRWTPRDQIQMMIDCGDPLFPPGAPRQWSYSDTGYVMLGLVLVKLTGRSLPDALRDLLPLDRLNLEETWHELLEREPKGPRRRAHQYFGPLDMTSWNPSFDSWGGGGYVSTVGDLTRFMRGLFDHRVFRHRWTLGAMMTWMRIPPGRQGPGSDGYGLGLAHYVFDGVECWGHPGFWSVIALYCPELDLALAGTTNQAADEHELEHTEGYLTLPSVRIVRRSDPLPPSLRATRRGRRVHLLFRAGDRPVGGATVRIGAGQVETTDALGRAVMAVGDRRRVSATACKPGVGCASARLRGPVRRSKMTACATLRCSRSS